MVEATRKEEIVEPLEDEVLRADEPIVECGDERVFARREWAERNLERGIGKLRHSDFAAVDKELRLQSHALHDEPRVPGWLVERKRAAVVRKPALRIPFRH